ncbi:MAG TPA: PilZ domain-containing protein, partial [Gemmataceae bacterium]|nr:PilZ domain-containing protein [Gemmataceae bacterium]
CGLAASYLTVASGDARRLRAEVIDLSADGLSLSVDRRLEPGRVLAITLQSFPHHCQTPLAYVVRARVSPGGWTVGCAFTRPLALEELVALA